MERAMQKLNNLSSIPHRPATGRHVDRGHRDEPVELAPRLCKNAATRDDDRINVLPNRV